MEKLICQMQQKINKKKFVIFIRNITSTNKETGINSEVLTVRSLIGVDPYGMSLRKTSDAGVSLFIFEQYYGKVCEYSLKV